MNLFKGLEIFTIDIVYFHWFITLKKKINKQTNKNKNGDKIVVVTLYFYIKS